MKSNNRITFIYTILALAICLIFALLFWFKKRLETQQKNARALTILQAKANQQEKPNAWFSIQNDLAGINQLGEHIKLSDLKGKVWLVAEFFAVCPMCAQRNGSELIELAKQFQNHPDFHIVCISVDPETDHLERLKTYSESLKVNPKQWWFMNAGDAKTTHHYLEKELKFFGVRERKDPADIATNGKYAHDLGFILVNRKFEVVGKWPLADARSEEAKQRDPFLYDRLKQELIGKIKQELQQP